MIRRYGPVTTINAQETPVLYPTYGHLVDGGRTWRVLVAGTVFEPGQVTLRKRIMLRLLQRVMHVSAEELQTEIFRQRIGGFIAATGGGRRIAVEAASRTFQLPKKTKRNGQFAGVLRIPRDQVDLLRDSGQLPDDWLDIRILLRAGDDRQFIGRVQLIPPRGASVVSDIDDTIKHSDVSCRRSLLANTFLNGFTSVEGMSHRFRAWNQQGATFHYVSSSPWQLFHPLQQLCHDDAFPDGTMHLRSFRIRDHMLRRMLLIRRPGKGVVIKRMLRTFPHRRFYLVGDSGERDPELYAALARRHRQQVAGIFIRQIAQRPMDEIRCQKAFRGLPGGLWHIFEHAHQLPGDLDNPQRAEFTPCVANLNP